MHRTKPKVFPTILKLIQKLVEYIAKSRVINDFGLPEITCKIKSHWKCNIWRVHRVNIRKAIFFLIERINHTKKNTNSQFIMKAAWKSHAMTTKRSSWATRKMPTQQKIQKLWAEPKQISSGENLFQSANGSHFLRPSKEKGPFNGIIQIKCSQSNYSNHFSLSLYSHRHFPVSFEIIAYDRLLSSSPFMDQTLFFVVFRDIT